jgi:hypothetical protein
VASTFALLVATTLDFEIAEACAARFSVSWFYYTFGLKASGLRLLIAFLACLIISSLLA